MRKHNLKKSATFFSALMTVLALQSATVPICANASANEENIFPYTMFASSDSDGAITVNAEYFQVNGSIASNGTIVTGKNTNIVGTKTENAEKDMIFIGDKIDNQYFSNSSVVDSLSISSPNVVVNSPLDVIGDASFDGNVNITSSVKADNDIHISGNVNNTHNAVIYSEFGDIIINSNNVNLNGIIYAPLGNVEINANNINLNNVVIIADTITLNSNNVNANYSRTYAEIAGNESESRADYIHKYNSWLMNRDIDAMVDMISEYYTLTPVDAGEFSTINIFNMFLFDVKQYEVEGLGNLSIMKTDGSNQMSTIVFSPYEKELPVISTDYMYNGEQRISYIEFYGLCSDVNSDDYQSVISKLNVLTEKYKDLTDCTPSSAWYDEVRTLGFFKMTNYTDDEITSNMLFDNFRTVLDCSYELPQLDEEQKALKHEAIQQYANNLVDMGGISTDMFKMAMGVDTTKEFFNNVFFGIANH